MRLLIASIALITASSAVSDDAVAELLQNVAQDITNTIIRKTLG